MKGVLQALGEQWKSNSTAVYVSLGVAPDKALATPILAELDIEVVPTVCLQQ